MCSGVAAAATASAIGIVDDEVQVEGVGVALWSTVVVVESPIVRFCG